MLHTSFGYNGEQWDEESNLQYLRARYYEPETGRFLSRDTYEGEKENPLSKHLYAYVENNPINFTDPSGHKKKKEWKTTPGNIKRIKELKNKDITKEFFYLLKVNENTTIAAKNTSNQLKSGLATIAYRYLWWYSMVDYYEEWDYKCYLGYTTKFQFLGKTITVEDFGNIHYGF